MGTWKIDCDKAADVVSEAIRIGYRHLDCACDYGNESEVGHGLTRALAEGVCRRDEIWVTSKLWNTYHDPRHVRPACERSLRDLQLDVLDLYLVHFPIALEYVPFERRYPPGWFFDPDASSPKMHPVAIPLADTWRAMEELYQEGRVKAIGVSNFYPDRLMDLIIHNKIVPAVNQVECHPFCQQIEAQSFMQDNKVQIESWGPFAEGRNNIFENETLQSIGEKYAKSVAQVILRWLIQRDVVVIPKTVHKERMVENLSVFDFELEPEDMDAILALDTKASLFFDHRDPEMVKQLGNAKLNI